MVLMKSRYEVPMPPHLMSAELFPRTVYKLLPETAGSADYLDALTDQYAGKTHVWSASADTLPKKDIRQPSGERGLPSYMACIPPMPNLTSKMGASNPPKRIMAPTAER